MPEESTTPDLFEIRRWAEAFNLADLDPFINGGARCCRGPQAIMDFSTTMLEDFDGTQEVERLVDGEDAVVVGVHSVGRSTSGIPVEFRWAVVQLRYARISCVDVHVDCSKAAATAERLGEERG